MEVNKTKHILRTLIGPVLFDRYDNYLYRNQKLTLEINWRHIFVILNSNVFIIINKSSWKVLDSHQNGNLHRKYLCDSEKEHQTLERL